MTSVRFRSSEMDIDYEENLYYGIIPFASHAFCIDDEFRGRHWANTHGTGICTPREENLMIHLANPNQI
jgi:hypothetical protein